MDRVDIAIIGAGFSGLGTAIRLRVQGIEDFVVLERHDDVGGTWWANTYPGCACDVPSHLYSFSFAPNPDWRQTYSDQAEIRAYLRRCAERYDLYRSIRLGTAVTGAAWDDDAGRWTIETVRGPASARVLVAGVGPLTEPSIPDLRGLDRFAGAVFHSARWDHRHDLAGERVAPSNHWYPALGEPNVELVTDGIREVRERSIVTADGTEREIDTIIFGTGFHVADMPISNWVRGRGGRRLADAWQGSPRAHLGTMVAGFPNLFVVLGPNTGLGHSSMVYMIESQINHVLDALRVMREGGAAVAEVRPEAQEAYNRELDAKQAGTVWNTGCASWYLDDAGRNPTLWPDWTWRFRRRTRRFDPAEHVLAPARVAAPRWSRAGEPVEGPA